MRKYFFHLLTFSLLATTNAFAAEGIIIVLEAPLLKEPNLSSPVLQTIRKGHKVYVPREVSEKSLLPEFIPTFDRAGNRAYIPSKYVKLITGTQSESLQSISYAGHDPTDYRLEEPLPANYPFADQVFARASLSAQIGNNSNSPYAYNTGFVKQKNGPERGLRLSVTRKVAFDQFDRFYFGFVGFASSATNNILFQNTNTVKESRGVVRAGPWITYDAYKTENFRLHIGSGFTFNYHRSLMEVTAGEESEQRIFSGFSISPMTSTAFQFTNIFPNTDIVGGVDFSLYLPHTMTSNEEPEITELWGESNQISSGLKSQVSLFLGVQVKF